MKNQTITTDRIRRIMSFLTVATFVLAGGGGFGWERLILKVGTLQWWKGNLHTHSLWSDGDHYPEMIMDWYKRHGYHFLALSDHNILATGEKWIDVTTSAGGMAAYRSYLVRFGSEWVEEKDEDSGLLVRLKTIEEYRPLFEEPGRFLVIQGEEITDRFETKPVHVSATNLLNYIPPQGGKSVLDVMQNNVDAVLDQRQRTGLAMFPHINHPNYGWAVTAEDIIALQGERFFEIYNGHPAVHNEGDSLHPSAERMWDIVLAERLSRGDEVIFGIAVDDAHNYHVLDLRHSNPGRGWVVVRAKQLTSDAIIPAMEQGDFYASTGIELDDIHFEDGRIIVDIHGEEGISYLTQFIGTRRGYGSASDQMIVGDAAYGSRDYSAEIGVVLAEVAGLRATYTLKGDEIYVRVKVVSSKPKANPYSQGEMEVAWIQPFVPQP